MRIILGILFISILSFYSCSKNFLDKEPYDSATNKIVLSSIQGIQSAINGCYNDLQSPYYYGRNFILINEVYSDNAKLSTNNVGHFASFYNYSVTSNDEDLKNLWATGYKIIANTNNIIDAISKIETATPNEKNIITGEALALRSLVYFDLVRMFAHNYSINASSGITNANGKGGHAGIPLITLPMSKDSLNKPSRATVATIYSQIISNLLQADSLLNNQELNTYKLNQNSVEALLSIVYLTTNQYNNAITYAEKVIGTSTYKLVPNAEYISSWSQESSSESIFSIAMTPTDYPGTNSIGHMLSPQGYGGIIPSNDISSLFSTNDIRKAFLKKENEEYFIKYPGRNNTLGLDNIPVIRLSELYFVIAECYAMKGKTTASFYVASQDILTELIQRTDKTAIPITVTGENLIAKIQEEYRKEFAFEGKRFFQLKRLGYNITRNDCNSTICELTNPSFYFAFPIPLAEINVNKNIVQNPGY